MASGDRQDRAGIVVPAVRDAKGAVDAAALRVTLQSLLDQTSEDFEALVVHRDTVEIEFTDPRIRSKQIDANDMSALLEAGLEELDTRWIRFLLPGDTLAPGCLAAELVALEADPGVSVVYAAVQRFDATGRAMADAGGPAVGRYEPGFLLPEIVGRNPWPLGAARIEREALVEIGGFDPSLVRRADHDLWIRLLTGRSALVLSRPGLRTRITVAEPNDLDGAEHARVLLRHLRGERLEAMVRALGGGARDAAEQGIARAELARRVLTVGRAELLPMVHRLVREARGAGAYFPADTGFEEFATFAPELARPEGWFPPLAASRGNAALVPNARPFPPPVVVAVVVDDSSSATLSSRLPVETDALRARGIEPLLLYASRVAAADAPQDLDVEILRHDGSQEEVETVLARWGVALVIADQSPVAHAARAHGVPVRAAWPTGGADEVARALIREAAAGAAHSRRKALAVREEEEERARAAEAQAGTLRVLMRALGDTAGATALVNAEPLTQRLSEARSEANAARRRVGEVDALVGRALDKLRIGRRLRETFQSPRTEGARSSAEVVSLDVARAERFLAAASAQPGRLWVVYTTDPYSETQGQRSTWLARELLARGDHVVFVYWRWELTETIADSPQDRLLSVPIDQFFQLQKPLMDLASPGLEKVFLVEFPDTGLFEQIDFANAHGFTTVYDCVDDWEEFARVGQAHWYDPGMERHLARNADVVVATHPVLAKRLVAMGRPEGSIPVIPNGVALDALADAPPRRRDGAPVIGYFGHLTPAWFDWDLIRDTASAHPEWAFDIIGHGAPEDANLPANVHVRGPVPHGELEAQTRSWHVGIVPFRPGRLTRAVDPIKLYEYLALGLPSVVVDMPHLRGLPCVEVCDRDGFPAALSRALSMPVDHDAVAAFVDQSRWGVRTDVLCEAVSASQSSDLLKAL